MKKVQRIHLCFVILFLISILHLPATSASVNVDLIGNLTGGQPNDIFITGGYVYASSSVGLQIFDISDPTAPAMVGLGETTSRSNGVYVSGDYAYLAAGVAGLVIFDISDPANPVEVGWFDTSGTAWDVFVSGNYAYLADGSRGLRIIDISDPSSPSETGYFDTASNAYGVYVSGSIAYVANDFTGLRIIDISNPANPSELGYYDTSGSSRGVVVSGNYAYLADGSPGLRVIDISNPASPSEAGIYSTGFCYDVFISGSYAYTANSSWGLRIFDISTPTSLTETGSWDSPGLAYGVGVTGNYAYIADVETGLRVVDISNPASPSESGSYNKLNYSYDIAVSGNYAYVADYNSGLRIIDISDPTAPDEISKIETNERAYGVFVSGNYAYIADYSAGLTIIDISNPASPSITGNYNTSGAAYDVFVSGNYAYVADGSSGMRVIDVSNPASPSGVGSYATPGTGRGIFVSGNYAYLADSNGLKVIDISNPASPSETGLWNSPGVAYDVDVAGDYAYLCDYMGGFRVLDISDPANPVSVGHYDTSGLAGKVHVSGNYAYISDGSPGLKVIDITDPTNPINMGYYDTPGQMYSVYFLNNYIYCLDRDFGLWICEFNLAAPPAITDLSIKGTSSGYVTLEWTSPGNSSIQAIQYDVRYSPTFITEDNWDSATQVPGEPEPKAVGNTETFTVPYLTEDSNYYFAVKSLKNAWSPISNTVGTTTGQLFAAESNTVSYNNNDGYHYTDWIVDVRVYNNSAQNATGVNLEIVDKTDWLIIDDASSVYPGIAANTSAWSAELEPFKFDLTNRPADTDYIRIWLDITYNLSTRKKATEQVVLKVKIPGTSPVPQNLRGDSTENGVELTWSEVEGAESYNIYRLRTGNWNKIGNSNRTVFIDRHVKDGNRYSYKITSLVNGKESGYSSIIKVKFEKAYTDLTQTVTYPNPARDKVAFDKIPAGCRIRIFSLTGDLVYETISSSNRAYWYLINRAGKEVGNGIYLYTIEKDGNVKAGKLAIVR